VEEVLGSGNGLRMERPRSPWEVRENPRQKKAKAPEEGGLTRSLEARSL